MFKNKNNISYLVVALIIVVIVLYHWNSYGTEPMMPQQDLTWKKISGESEFRNMKFSEENPPTNIPYSKVPLQDDPAYITGMNQYLWDKQKGKLNPLTLYVTYPFPSGEQRVHKFPVFLWRYVVAFLRVQNGEFPCCVDDRPAL